MHIIWLTTQFPVGEKNRNGMFIYRTVTELSKMYKITVIVLHPVIPPFLPMLKNIRNWKKIYNEWRDKYPVKPVKPKEAENLNVIYSNYYRPPRPKIMFAESWGSFFNVNNIIKKYSNDKVIIHANWIFPEGYLANLLLKRLNIPYILTLRGSDVRNINKKSLNRYFADIVFASASKVTAVTDSLFEETKKKGIVIPSDKLAITNNFYDFKKFSISPRTENRKKLNLRENKKIIFFAGALRKIKNIYLLLDSINELQQEKEFDLLLILAGYGYEESNLQKYISQKKLESDVIFVGNLNPENLISYYNAADTLCLPSFSEGFPNVVVESLMCGTPVIAASVGGIPKIIRDAHNGYLIDPYSKNSLTTALRETLNRKWNREELRESVSFLSTKNVMQQYSSMYNEVFKTISR